jgi:hypothetical protein
MDVVALRAVKGLQALHRRLLAPVVPSRGSPRDFGTISEQNYAPEYRKLADQRTKANRIIRTFGRGGGDRTHDLRLKRPLLYH